MSFMDIETPSVLIDLNIVEANIDKYQSYCNKKGINLRPHIKTHKIPELANLQLQAGAIGVTCQKISEAEAMISEVGINDILITFNIFGQKILDVDYTSTPCRPGVKITHKFHTYLTNKISSF